MGHSYYSYTKEELVGNGPKLPVIVMEDNAEVFHSMAVEMVDEIKKHNEKGEKTVFICPVGPVGQYPYFVDMVNEQNISLKNVWFINMDEYLTDDKEWIDKEDFIDLLALTQSVPGIFAVNIAIFIGYKLRKFRGALAMALGTILPSFFIILAIALFFQQFKQYPIVENIFKGIRPAVVALIAAPTFSMAKSAKINRYTVWIPIVSALLIWVLDVSPVYIIIIAGVGGFIYGKYKHKYSSK